MKKCEQARDKIIAESFNTNIVCRECDLASIESIKHFADDINKNEKYLHLLINNAGIMWHPLKLTKDGFEQHLGVNYLGVSRIKLKILKLKNFHFRSFSFNEFINWKIK